MAKKLYESLESGEEIKFRDVDYSDPKIKEKSRKISEKQNRVVREAEHTLYEMSQVCFSQFHPFYKK